MDGVIVSDYAKGVVCQQLMDRIKEKKVFVSIDPRPVNKHLYFGADLMTPTKRKQSRWAETNRWKRSDGS